MRKTVKITRENFVKLLADLGKKATFVSIQMRSEPALRSKKSPLVGRCLKIQGMNGMIGYDYEADVNRSLEKQGEEADFVAKAPAWGTRIGDTCLIEHKGEHYFDLRVLRSLRTRYAVDGKTVAKSTIADQLRPSSKPTAGVCVRRPKIRNITSIKMLGVKYRLVNGA
jgi:hypothetical protein